MEVPVPSPMVTSQPPQLCRTRRCLFRAAALKFPLRRPQWAGARRTVRPDFARRKVRLTSQEGVPRSWGSGAATPMNTRLWRGVHRRSPPAAFWLLCRRGQSNIRSLKGKNDFIHIPAYKCGKINKPRCKSPRTDPLGRSVHCRSPPRWAARRPAPRPSGQ